MNLSSLSVKSKFPIGGKSARSRLIDFGGPCVNLSLSNFPTLVSILRPQ